MKSQQFTIECLPKRKKIYLCKVRMLLRLPDLYIYLYFCVLCLFRVPVCLFTVLASVVDWNVGDTERVYPSAKIPALSSNCEIRERIAVGGCACLYARFEVCRSHSDSFTHALFISCRFQFVSVSFFSRWFYWNAEHTESWCLNVFQTCGYFSATFGFCYCFCFISGLFVSICALISTGGYWILGDMMFKSYGCGCWCCCSAFCCMVYALFAAAAAAATCRTPKAMICSHMNERCLYSVWLWELFFRVLQAKC